MDTFKGVSRAIIIAGLGIMSATFYLGNTQRYELVSNADGTILHRLDKRTGQITRCIPMQGGRDVHGQWVFDQLSAVCPPKLKP